MEVKNVTLTLLIGGAVPTPAPPMLMNALDSVTVTRRDEGRAGFQINFKAERTPSATMDYPLLENNLLKPQNRVVIIVNMNGQPNVLMDGFITNQQLMPATAGGLATITVTGEDVSLKLDMEDNIIGHQVLGPLVIVGLILGKYADLGLVPKIVPPLTTKVRLPVEGMVRQTETDLGFIERLSAMFGYVFHISPGPAPLVNTAYWGPRKGLLGLPKTALNVDMGSFTNVEDMSFGYDSTAPYLIDGAVLDPSSAKDIAVKILSSMHVPPLARMPAIASQPNIIKRRVANFMFREGAPENLESAQGLANQSADDTVSVRGEVNTARYGDLIIAPGLVGMRGAGQKYDGIYYVKNVTHTIRRGEYKQSFQLSREGLGSLTPVVLP